MGFFYLIIIIIILIIATFTFTCGKKEKKTHPIIFSMGSHGQESL